MLTCNLTALYCKLLCKQHLLDQGPQQRGRRVPVGPHRAAVNDAGAQALVGGEAVLENQLQGGAAQRGAGNAQKVQ